MIRLFYKGIFLILLWGCMAQTAFALAEVKSSTVVSTSTVTLGDVLENLDTGNDIWVMNSPAPGQKTTLSTKYLANLTKQHDVYWQNSRSVRQITIIRKGKSIKYARLTHLIKQNLKDLNLSNPRRGISFDNNNATLNMPEGSSINDITIKEFNFDKRTGKFSALASFPLDGNNRGTAIIRGRTHSISYVPTLNKNIPSGQVITAQDIDLVSVPTRRIDRNIIRDKMKIIGMTPRRSLNTAEPIRSSDLERPQIIDRGQTVSILYRSGKISLTALGKTIKGGGLGDVINVMNTTSHKTLEAVIIGPNQVQVITPQNNLAQLSSLRSY